MAIACTGYRVTATRWTLVALLPYMFTARITLPRDELGEPLGLPDTRHVIE